MPLSELSSAPRTISKIWSLEEWTKTPAPSPERMGLRCTWYLTASTPRHAADLIEHQPTA